MTLRSETSYFIRCNACDARFTDERRRHEHLSVRTSAMIAGWHEVNAGGGLWAFKHICPSCKEAK